MSLGGIGEILVSSIVQVIMFSIIPLIWWFLTARDKESFFHWIGLKKPRIKGSMIQFLLIILGVVGAYLLIIALVMARLLGDTETATTQFTSQGWGALLKILIYAIVQTGLSEEILFRGFIGKRLIHSLGFVGGNTVQALLFGLMHGLPFGFITGNLLVTVLLTLIPGLMGWVEGWLNEKYAAGSIIPSWMIHSIMNILSALNSALSI